MTLLLPKMGHSRVAIPAPGRDAGVDSGATMLERAVESSIWIPFI
jgi:hypothetical protein